MHNILLGLIIKLCRLCTLWILIFFFFRSTELETNIYYFIALKFDFFFYSLELNAETARTRDLLSHRSGVETLVTESSYNGQ